ncbi:thioredoxin domain-containing protein 8-like [Ctenodactylus gundi]
MITPKARVLALRMRERNDGPMVSRLHVLKFLPLERSDIRVMRCHALVVELKSTRAGLPNELKDFLKAAGHKLVVVEFSAKWCGPCKMMCPIIQAMSVKYQNVMFANVDVDDSQELAESCHVRVVPTFQLFKQTKKVTLFSRLKRAICCYRSGFVVKQVFEFCGADAKTLEEKIQELM